MKIHDLFVPFDDELQLLPSPRVSRPPLIEWKSAFGDLFFRIKGEEPTILWCDLGYTITPKRPLPANRGATLAKRLSRAFNGRTFFRVVPFSTGDDWALVRPKRALVKSPLPRRTPTRWSRNADFADGQKQIEWLSQPFSALQTWLEEHRDVELELARAFAPLDEEARAWAPFVGEEGARSKWQQLVPALQKLCLSSDASFHFV